MITIVNQLSGFFYTLFYLTLTIEEAIKRGDIEKLSYPYVEIIFNKDNEFFQEQILSLNKANNMFADVSRGVSRKVQEQDGNGKKIEQDEYKYNIGFEITYIEEGIEKKYHGIQNIGTREESLIQNIKKTASTQLEKNLVTKLELFQNLSDINEIAQNTINKLKEQSPLSEASKQLIAYNEAMIKYTLHFRNELNNAKAPIFPDAPKEENFVKAIKKEQPKEEIPEVMAEQPKEAIPEVTAEQPKEEIQEVTIEPPKEKKKQTTTPKKGNNRIYEQEEREFVMNVDLSEHLMLAGYDLENSDSKNYQLKQHDSFKINKETEMFQWFSTGKSGRGKVEIMAALYDVDKPHAIRMMTDALGGIGKNTSTAPRTISVAKKVEKPKEEFVLPEKNDTHKRAFAYLQKTRGIDADIISHYMHEGLIYEDKEHHNVVFVGQKDEQGRPQYASKRGTITSAEKPFKGDATGSDKSYSFAMEGKSDRVIVCEAAIDALSHATIEKLEGRDWRQDHRATLGGMSDSALERYLKKHPEIKKISFHLDNDKDGKSDDGKPCNHGQIRAAKLMEKYGELGYEVDNQITEAKDINEDLKNMIASGVKSKTNVVENNIDLEQEIDASSVILEQGVRDVFTSEKYLTYLNVMSKFHPYSVNNNILIMQQKPNATKVAGFVAWEKNFQRKVKPTAKAIYILAPITKKHKKEVVDKETGEIKTVIENVNTGKYRRLGVFDVSQTEGKELPKLTSELIGNSDTAKMLMASIVKSIEKQLPVEFKDIQGEVKGYFAPKENVIFVKEGMSDIQTVKTLIHEYAHARMHTASDIKNQEKRGIAEVEAESIAFTVCDHFGIDTSTYSFPYIAAWSSNKDVKELMSSLNLIKKESTKIIEPVEKQLAILQEKALQKSKVADLASVSKEAAMEAFSKEVPVYLLDNNNERILIKSKADIESHKGKYAIIMVELDKNKHIIPAVYDECMGTLFKQCFLKNPMGTLEIFAMSVKLNGLNEVVLNNCRNDEKLKMGVEHSKTLTQCKTAVNDRLKEFNNRKANVMVCITSEKNNESESNVLSVVEANKLLKALDENILNENITDIYKAQISLYTNQNETWQKTDLRYDLGSNEYENLMECIEKNCDKEVSNMCKQSEKSVNEKTKNKAEKEMLER